MIVPRWQHIALAAHQSKSTPSHSQQRALLRPGRQTVTEGSGGPCYSERSSAAGSMRVERRAGR